MRALTNLTLPAYDADLLLAVTASSGSSPAGGITHLTLLADTLPFAFFDQFLDFDPTIEHLSLRPAAIFGALLGDTFRSQVKMLTLVLAPDMDTGTQGRLLGDLAKMGEGLEVLELRLEGTSDEVRIPSLHAPVVLDR